MDAMARATAGRGELLERARRAYARRDWVVAREHFREAAAGDALAGADLYALANCSWWLGDLDEALPALERAYRCYLQEGSPRTAALVALDVGYTCMIRGDAARGSSWLSRAVRLLEDEGPCAERGSSSTSRTRRRSTARISERRSSGRTRCARRAGASTTRRSSRSACWPKAAY